MNPELEKKPTVFGKYLLVDRISIGGMAEVWRAKARDFDGPGRWFAIKRLLPSVAEHPELVSLFIDEAKIMLRLCHPNIARVFELGQAPGGHFIAMEYIAGSDLKRVFERCRACGGPAPIPITCLVLSHVCDALDFAHRQRDDAGQEMKLVHRDVSPSNILVGYRGEVKLIDFGIAKSGDVNVSSTFSPNGKIAYISPEQAQGLPIDRRSDIFGVGVCLYELLMGQRLFARDSRPAVLDKLRKGEIALLGSAKARLPAALVKIMLRALATDPESRYQYASELAEDLRKLLIGPSGNFQTKDLVEYMQSTFAEEIEREQQRLLEHPEGGPPTNPHSLLPKIVPAGPLLSNDIVPAGDTKAFEDRPAYVPERPEPLQVQSDAAQPITPAPESRLDASDPAATEPTAPIAVSRAKTIGLGMIGAAVVIFVAAVGFAVADEMTFGFLSISLPPDLNWKKVAVTFRGEPLPVRDSRPILHKAKPGNGLLVVHADEYQPSSQWVEVKGAREITQVPIKLAPMVRMAQLAVVPEPEDAEVRIDRAVVKPAVRPGFYLGELPVGTERLVEVRRAGYKSFESRVKAPQEGEQVRVTAKLQPLEYSLRVQSVPSGAIIWANGARLGRTPTEIHVLATAEITLRKRCFEPLQLAFPKEEAKEPTLINVSLKRSPGCR